MKILKWILIIIGVIIAIPLVAALFMPKDINVERQVTINKSKAEVFSYVKLLKNQDSYSYWASKDPNMKKTYTGTDGTVGFVSHWESDSAEVGWGEQEIKKIADGERIDYELRFLKPMEDTNQAYMITESSGDNQTVIKWGFNGHMNYPMNAMFPLFKGILEDQFQAGLDNLKGVLEKMPATEKAAPAQADTTQVM